MTATDLTIAAVDIAVDSSTYPTGGAVTIGSTTALTLDSARVIASARAHTGQGAFIVKSIIRIDADYALPGDSTVVLTLNMTVNQP